MANEMMGDIQNNTKMGGDANVTAQGTGEGTVTANTTASGTGEGSMAGPEGLSMGEGTGIGMSDAGGLAMGAGAEAVGGDVMDQTSISSINING